MREAPGATHSPSRFDSIRRLLLVALLAAIYALCYSAIKTGLAYAPPLRFAGLRATIGGATLFGILLIRRRPLLLGPQEWPWITALALIGTLMAYGGMFLSPGVTGAGIASVLGNTGPLFVIILAAIFLGEPTTRGKLGAVALGMFGITLVTWPHVTDPGRSGTAGALLPLLAALGFAASSVLFKRFGGDAPLLRVAAWQLTLGGLLLLGVSAAFEPGEAIRWSGAFASILLFLGVVGSAFTLWLWYWLVQQDDVGRLSLLLFFVPLLGLLLAVTLFGEAVGGLELVGVGVTLSALAVVVWETVVAKPSGLLADD